MNKFVEFHREDGSLYATSIDAVTSFEPCKETNGTILRIGCRNVRVVVKEPYDEVKIALTGHIDIPKRIPYFSAEELECALTDERKRNECDMTHCATCRWISSNVGCKYEILADYINRKLEGVNENGRV